MPVVACRGGFFFGIEVHGAGFQQVGNEINRFFVTVRATPVVFNENMAPGTVAEFDKLASK